ncbi:uncharacterized protein LOC119400872 [Rhipicephalus sanguineus]|uniref:uncharacterized protein LOC119400872 n=1 Tax=Rhipicephalus sanguineus TaxID=34632 RepID=UPI0018962986|nr:uncharacterized protein LOC119400872 [Rhipicephalus sanguineus]
MLSATFVVFAAGVLAMAEDASAASCSAPGTPNGWDFVKDNTKYNMIKRNFKLGGIVDTQCLSSTFKHKKDTEHRVDAEVQFQAAASGEWFTIEQRYQFYLDSGDKYNTMTTTDDSSSPKATYQFGYTGEHCAVVFVDNIEGLSSETSATKKCVLWLEDGHEEDSCCNTFLEDNCDGDFNPIYKATCKNARK